jgi:hypothetical protein
VTLLWIFLIAVLVVVGAGVGLLRTAVRWSHELKELEQYGVETTGTVDRKITYNTKGGRSRYIRYAYTDQFGKRHTRKTIVLGDAWDQYQEGGPIPVVYSQRTPRVSAAKYVYESMSKAIREKQVGKPGTV